ncbi:unnamed protein product, partial [Heterosigma akashiwo]
MSRVYDEWTLDEDQLLYQNREKPIDELAKLLGRGPKGIESRLIKLLDVDGAAYSRLFVEGSQPMELEMNRKQKLIPAKEILQRIRWDASLSQADFSVLIFDRVENKVIESSMDAPNHSVQGSEKQLVFAIPDHRVVAVKYKDRIVWDRENRIDLINGSGQSEGENIEAVINNYDEWKTELEAVKAWQAQKQNDVMSKIKASLRPEQFASLKKLSRELQDSAKGGGDGAAAETRVNAYVQKCLALFRAAAAAPAAPCSSPPAGGAAAPLGDLGALGLLADLALILPDGALRAALLADVAR